MKKLLLFALFLNAGQVLAFPWYSSGDGIRGAELMTPEERKAYASKLPTMQSWDECRAYVTAHNLEIERRAQAKGVTLPPVSGDPCQVMRGFGRIK
jgi:hypothetical protein